MGAPKFGDTSTLATTEILASVLSKRKEELVAATQLALAAAAAEGAVAMDAAQI